jgi:hypothetical protein
VIDTHNQLHQDGLKLEKKWLTQSPWFHLVTMLIGVVVTNMFLLCNYHNVFWYFGPSADPDGKQA